MALDRLDQNLLNKIVNSNQRGSEVLDYIGTRYRISENDWEKFASGRHASLYDARDPESKKKIIKLMEKMASHWALKEPKI